MKLYRFLLIVALFIGLGGCDIITDGYEELTPTEAFDQECIQKSTRDNPFAGNSDPIAKKVLLEEMTGHQCGNCPQHTEVGWDLYQNVFQDRMVFLSIHTGPLARFVPSASKYYTDFTTETGTALQDEFNPDGTVPFGMINRTTFGFGSGSWESKVTAELDKSAEVGIHLTNCFDDDSRRLTIVANLKYLINSDENDYLAVYLVEDEIKDWQKDYRLNKVDIEEYKHHNVLRATINGTWGQPISEGAIAADELFQLSYGYEIPEEYDADKCYIIAFVHDFETKEIRQVEIIKVDE
ncbi:MAG: Omp28-related outer membrane protein [Bacteroidota bacterium]